MPELGPLGASQELQAVNECLNQGDLEQAQQRLARAGEHPEFEPGVAYLATRLLYLKGRLDRSSVAQRLTELVGRVSPFPEAEALLRDVAELPPLPQQGEVVVTTSKSPSRRPVVALGFRDTQEVPIPVAPRLPRVSIAPEPASPVVPALPQPSPSLAPRPSVVPRNAGRYSFVSERAGNAEGEAGPSLSPDTIAASRPSLAASRRGDSDLLAPSPEAGRQDFDHQAWHATAELRDPRDPVALAHVAAKVLSHSLTTHWFAPFDMSLPSLARLGLALDALLGNEPIHLAQSSLSLLSAYLGETVRACHRGEWQASERALEGEVLIGAFSFRPHDILDQRVASGKSTLLLDELAPGLAPEGTAPWLAHGATLPSRSVWRNSPLAEDFPHIASGLLGSPWSRVCATHSGVPLDLSWESLTGLEWLVDCLARSSAPLRGNEPWLVRLSILVGAYVGEVVRQRSSTAWRTSPEGPSEEGYRLVLPSGFEAEPVAAIKERVKAQNGVRLLGYATALLRK